MSPDWKQNVIEAMDLQRLLQQRQTELGPVTEAAIDQALNGPDPLARLRDLALAEKEREILLRALRRVETILHDLRARARLIERNLAKKVR